MAIKYALKRLLLKVLGPSRVGVGVGNMNLANCLFFGGKYIFLICSHIYVRTKINFDPYFFYL